MGPSLFLLVAGTLLIGFRRSMAQGVKRYHDRFDRAYDEDGLAWYHALLGWVLIGLGTVFLGIWLFG